MTTLSEGTRNSLDYVSTKLRNMIDDFYYGIRQNERFTPDIDSVCKLEEELDIVENMTHTGFCDKSNWKLVSKYTSLGNEFRFIKSM